MVAFNHHYFNDKTLFKYFNVIANKTIKIGNEAFNSAEFGIINLYANGPIVFANNSFFNCATMELLSLSTNADITFDPFSFQNSKMQEMSIHNYDEHQLITDQIFYGTVKFCRQSFSRSRNLNRIIIQTKGNVYLDENSFEKNEVLSTVLIKSNGTLHIGNNAFVDCFSGAQIYIDSKENEISPCAKGGSCKKKKIFGCSPNKDDDVPKSGPAKLGNIQIKTVYLGLSPTIYFNLNFFINMMKNLRRLFGHVIPPPDFIHSAIWVADSDDTDQSLGAIFVYGKYYNIFNDRSYIEHDGARSYVMTLNDFKKKYSSKIIKLKPKKNVKLFDFIDNLKKEGKLTADEYNWPTNNCQHFTSRCIDILDAVREVPDKDDWINLPKLIFKELEKNEKKKEN